MHTAKTEGKSAVQKFVLLIKTVKQDMGNALKVTASIGYHLMTAVIWSSADDKQMKSLFCPLHFIDYSPSIFIVALPKQSLIALKNHLGFPFLS